MKSTQEIVANVDEIFELVKKIKGSRNRYQGKYEKVETARKEVSDLKSELVAVSQAMFNNEDTSSLRDPATISRDITRAEARYEKARERNAEDVDAMDALCARLASFVAEPPAEIVEEEDSTKNPFTDSIKAAMRWVPEEVDEEGDEPVPAEPRSEGSSSVNDAALLDVQVDPSAYSSDVSNRQEAPVEHPPEVDEDDEMDFSFSEHLGAVEDDAEEAHHTGQ